MKLTKTEIERFWSKVDRKGPNDCWLWTGAKHVTNRRYTPMVYGQFGIARDGKAYNRNAHRFAWMIANGQEPPTGWVICHKCDTPLCCNPAHLFAGTRADNQRDMQAKLRSGVLGTKNPKAKLTESQVLDIRASSESDAALARVYDVDVATIYAARVGKKWRHLPGAKPKVIRRKLTPAQVAELRQRNRSGEDCVSLGRAFGISQCFAWQVAKGHAYKSIV